MTFEEFMKHVDADLYEAGDPEDVTDEEIFETLAEYDDLFAALIYSGEKF